MIDAAFIKKVFHASAVKSVKCVNGICVGELRETDPSASLKAVDLYGLSPDAVLIKLDSGLPPADILSKSGGQHQRCDYLVVTEYKNKKILIYIDLKSASSGKVQTGHVKRQFKGGVCFVKYFDAVMETFHGRPDFFASFDEVHYVVFYKPLLQKCPSRSLEFKCNQSIDKFLKYPNPFRPKIRQLIGW